MPVNKNKSPALDDEDNNDLKIVKHYHAQCLAIKDDIYKVMSNLHRDYSSRLEDSDRQAEIIIAKVGKAIDEALNIKTSISKEIAEAKAVLHEESSKLDKQRVEEKMSFDKVLKRMDDLENYIKNDRFHDLVKDINDLEDEFEKEAIKLVQNRMSAKNKVDKNILNKSINSLKLTVRAFGCLKSLGIDTIGNLIEHTEYSLLKNPNFGSKSLKEIKDHLGLYNLKLKGSS